MLLDAAKKIAALRRDITSSAIACRINGWQTVDAAFAELEAAIAEAERQQAERDRWEECVECFGGTVTDSQGRTAECQACGGSGMIEVTAKPRN